MKRLCVVMVVVLGVVTAMPAVMAAQAKPVEKIVPTEQATTAPVTLKVTVVLSRYAGEKKIANLPFVLMVIAGDSTPTTVQMSANVPIAQNANKDSYSYQNFGTSITATARSVEGAQYIVSLDISDQQLMSDSVGGVPDALKGLAKFQSFRSAPRLLLRDGQTVQYPAATDKFTGEIVKVDVTLNVIK